MTRDPVAIVQPAADPERLGAALDALFEKMDRTDAQLLDWRVEAGNMLAEARKAFPQKGPKAKAWGDFLQARKLTQASAARYMRLAVFIAEHPELRDQPVHVVYEKMGEVGSGWGREVSFSAARYSGSEKPLLTATSAAPPPPAGEVVMLELRETTAPPPPAAAPGPVTRLVLDPASPVGQMLAEKPLPPVRPAAPRTAAPAATTLVLDLPPPAPASNEVEKEATSPAPAAAPPMDEGEGATASRLTSAEEEALRGGGSALDLDEDEDEEPAAEDQAARAAALETKVVRQQEQLARGEEEDAEDAYPVADRIAVLRVAGCLRDVPEADRPAMAAALRGLAEDLAPPRRACEMCAAPALDEFSFCEGHLMSSGLGAKLQAAETRVRQLEAQVTELEEQLHRCRNELTKAQLRADLAGSGKDKEREQLAARHGYEQGQEAAFSSVARMLEVEIPEDLEDAEIKLEEHIEELRTAAASAAELRADAEEVRAARLKLQELGEQLTRMEAELERVRGDRDQVVVRWEEEGPRRARLTALLRPGQPGPLALLDAAADEIERLRGGAPAAAADGAVPPQDALLDAARALGRQHAHERLRAFNKGERRKLLMVLGEPDAEETRAAAALLVYGRAFDEEKANPADVCDAKHPTGPARCGRAPHGADVPHRGADPHTAVEWREPEPATGRAAARAARAALRGEGPPVDLGGAAPEQRELRYERDPGEPAGTSKPPPKRAARRTWQAGAEVIVSLKKGPRRAVVAEAREDGVCHLVLRAAPGQKADVSARSWLSQELTADPKADGRGIVEALKVLRACPVPPEAWIEELERRRVGGA